VSASDPACTGAVLLFAGAVIMRLRRGEMATVIGDLVYLAMAAFAAWGRCGPGSFTRLTPAGRRRPGSPAPVARGALPARPTRFLTVLRGLDRTVGSGRFARHDPYRQRASRPLSADNEPGPSSAGEAADDHRQLASPAAMYHRSGRIARTIIGAPAACPAAQTMTA